MTDGTAEARYGTGKAEVSELLPVAIGVNADEIHKWAHRSPPQNGRLISLLQRVGILQSPRHHAEHQRGEKNTHYCTTAFVATGERDREAYTMTGRQTP